MLSPALFLSLSCCVHGRPDMLSSTNCELLLCAACLGAALVSHRDRHGWRVLGFVLIALTALVGAEVYAGEVALHPSHQFLSSVSGRVSLLLIAVGSLHGVARPLLLIALAALMLWLPEPAVLAGNLLALIAIAWPGRSRRWPLAIAGSLLFVLAGLVVGTRGEWMGLLRLDIYHLTLMLAALCWMLARLSGTRWTRRPSPLLIP